LEQGATIVQQVYPVPYQDRAIPALLQVETSLIAWERQKRRHESFRQAVDMLREMVLRGDLAEAASLPPFTEWDGILFVDDKFRIQYLSGIANNFYRRLGYLDELHGRHIGDLQTHDELLVREAFASQACRHHQVMEGSLNWTRVVVPIWSYRPAWWPFGRNGRGRPELRGALVMVHDNTEALRKAQELKVLTTMVQEVHHRVKNNLQTVASILRMQARRAESEEARLLLHEAVNRVLAVSVIHEFLSRDEQQVINIRDVCQRIVTQTQRAAMQPEKAITLQVDGPAIYLPSQQATACALVANELLLNALEHAFEGRGRGSVQLSLKDRGDEVALEVADDGIGLPVNFDLDAAESLGLSIVRTLVEGDLRGQLVLEPGNPGTQVIVTFQKGHLED
jgi:two-component sensor histidine kinase